MLYKLMLYKLLGACIFLSISGYIYAGSTIDFFELGNDTLSRSEVSGKAAGQAIIDANMMRRDIRKLRARAKKSIHEEKTKEWIASANELAATMQNLQTDGALLREKESHLFKKSLNYLEEGMVSVLGDKIRTRNPILMADNTALFFAHNTKFRSVHPNMLNKMGTAIENRAQIFNLDDGSKNINTGMSLMIPALAEQNVPQELDISSFQLSRERQFYAHIEVVEDKANHKAVVLDDHDLLGEGESDSDPYLDDSIDATQYPTELNLAPPNTIHSWLFMITDLYGNRIEYAEIDVGGHMPGHVHGLPTQPRVTKEIHPGIYRVEGMKFQMKGWWVVEFTVRGVGHKVDSIIFNLVL